MRKIITKEKREKKETRNKVIIGVLLVGLMVLGTVGYAFFSGLREEKAEKINYKGIEFILSENGLWLFEIQGFEFLMQYNPKETENISVPIFMTVNNYGGKPLFFVGEGAAKLEITRNLGSFALWIQDACLEDYNECEEDSPTKSCSQDNIIIIKEAEDIKISEEDNCIFLASPYSEQTRTADAFLLKILGVRS